AFLEKGTLRGDWRRDERTMFKPAYKWLCQQMEQRGIKLAGRPPMWAWTKRPDLRSGGNLERGAKGVRLEIEIPESLVLISNFEAWHCVLNNHFLVTHDDELDGMFDRPRHEVVESWQKIFQLEHINALPGYNDLTQATFSELLPEHVVDTTPFVSR
ncbi:MAG: DUF3841 domain-containing protein, partial [Nitrospiraceae bacterium]